MRTLIRYQIVCLATFARGFALLEDVVTTPAIASRDRTFNNKSSLSQDTKSIRSNELSRKRAKPSTPSSPSSPILFTAPQFTIKAKSVLPNPYRDEFIKERENLVKGIDDLITKIIKSINPSSDINLKKFHIRDTLSDLINKTMTGGGEISPHTTIVSQNIASNNNNVITGKNRDVLALDRESNNNNHVQDDSMEL